MTDLVTILAFGKEYPISRDQLKASEFLATAFSGRFNRTNTIELDFDPELEQAFDYIYMMYYTIQYND